MDDLLADFLTETSESLAELDVALVRLERTPDDDKTLSQIFRLVHTIKGTCGFLGLPRLERVAHAGENVLGRVRDKLLPVSPDIISVVLTGIDRIRFIVAELAASGAEPQGDDVALIAELNAIADGKVPATLVAAAPPAVEEAATTKATSGPVDSAPATAAPATAAVGAAERAAGAPTPAPAAAVAPAPFPVQASPPAPVTAAQPAPARIAAAETAPPAEATGESHAGMQTIRVGVDVLEDLMTLVSELVLTRNQLLQIARSQESKAGEMGAFSVPLQRLSHITSDLQEGVMKTRMQPIGNAWNKLPRLVRDLARDLDKKIELQMLGQETELDRQVLELIKDPLTHMVRNSGDHGLETPAERRAVGKSETGRITLNAFHEGGHILIEIADDGRGLAVDRIRAKIASKGLATDAELAGMTDAQVQRFIFRAGFSTASEITAVSGRGVGMDVVKTNIERIGGTIDLRSTPGQGSCFTIKIPLTLAIVSALIVEAGGERFAIPQISVVELVRARRLLPQATTAAGSAESDDIGDAIIETINGTSVLRLRERLLPLVSLNDLLCLGAPGGKEGDGRDYIVIAQVGASTLGIIVDRVFDTEEIVVKPVAPILRHITMFSGNTILGDGSVIMILDPNGLARASGVSGVGGSRGNRADDAARLQEPSADRMAMLLFRAGGPAPMAVPLALVARLEDISRDKIETSSGKPVTQYRGRLMPLVPLSGVLDMTRERQSVLVFNDVDGGIERGRCMGLVVDEIVDVVEDVMSIELSGTRPGVLGTAVVAGSATDVIDTGYWLTQAHQDWFHRRSAGAPRAARVLVVEDSDFFRQLLVPTLSAAGYDVKAVADAQRALALRDAGAVFEAIISDIEMPDMDGIVFVRTVRAQGPWKKLPVIALSGRAGAHDIDAARAAGFTDFVEKFERDALLASLAQCLAAQTTSARADAVGMAA